ncbi:MAG: GNAT family N-acetyltransferase [Deltaproteobacteria bacterium]|nr:GNAT family N-acetyltransferase [Deltaproteobacteria bacterium]
MAKATPFAETARLLLLRPTPEIRDTLFRWLKDPELTRYVGGVRDDDKIVRTVEFVLQSWETVGFGKCILIDKLSAQVVGMAGVTPLEFEKTRVNDLGYLVDAPYAGKGYATEACLEVLKQAFERHKLERVTAWPDARNAASIRIAQKLGLQFVRELNLTYLGMKFEGQHLYEVTRAQWLAKTARD